MGQNKKLPFPPLSFFLSPLSFSLLGGLPRSRISNRSGGEEREGEQ